MPSLSPLERAIQGVGERGWLIKGLGKSSFKTTKPWSCDVHPGHFKDYVWGKPVKTGLYTVYEQGMVRFVTDGATALEAVQNAIAKIDASKEKRIYERFEKALSRWADAIEAAGNS